MMTALATNAQAEPAKLVVPGYGVFLIEPQAENRIRVQTQMGSGVVIDGLLYRVDGTMVKNSEGWYFAAEDINVPKASPKQKKALVDKLTDRVNAFMEEHADFMDVLRVKVWLRERVNLEYVVQRAQEQLDWQSRGIDDRKRQVNEAQAKLTKHLADAPEGLDVQLSEPATVTVGEVVS